MKQCKYCGTFENLFSFKRKRDSIVSICNCCKLCYSKILRDKNTGKKHSEKTKQKLHDINVGKKLCTGPILPKIFPSVAKKATT